MLSVRSELIAKRCPEVVLRAVRRLEMLTLTVKKAETKVVSLPAH
jgi:hypothetical protein